jgi:Ser/Thr protein kinase RdoA (MazF antagonist)
MITSPLEPEQIKENVHRVHVRTDEGERSLIVKWCDTLVAYRNRLVAQRWLPAAGLADLGPSLLEVQAARNGEGAWLVFEDLRGVPLSSDQPRDDEVEAAINAIARVHTGFAGHSLLRECRHAGGERGIAFYSANVRDATAALHSLDAEHHGAARDDLLRRMRDLELQASERARALERAGGPETLLHGDLWPVNAIVLADGDSCTVRFVDWDEAGVGPAGYDLSTFLLRFDPPRRRAIVEHYAHAVDRLAGWKLPSEQDLDVIFETAAFARLASLLVWSIAAAQEGDSGWLAERLSDMVAWLEEVHPVLPAR